MEHLCVFCFTNSGDVGVSRLCHTINSTDINHFRCTTRRMSQVMIAIALPAELLHYSDEEEQTASALIDLSQILVPYSQTMAKTPPPTSLPLVDMEEEDSTAHDDNNNNDEPIHWSVAERYLSSFPVATRLLMAKAYYKGKPPCPEAMDADLVASYLGDNIWSTGVVSLVKALPPALVFETLGGKQGIKAGTHRRVLAERIKEQGLDAVLNARSFDLDMKLCRALRLSTMGCMNNLKQDILWRGLSVFYNTFGIPQLHALAQSASLRAPPNATKAGLITALMHYTPSISLKRKRTEDDDKEEEKGRPKKQRTLEQENRRYNHEGQCEIQAILDDEWDYNTSEAMFRTQWKPDGQETFEPATSFIHRNAEGIWFDTTDIWLDYLRDLSDNRGKQLLHYHAKYGNGGVSAAVANMLQLDWGIVVPAAGDASCGC